MSNFPDNITNCIFCNTILQKRLGSHRFSNYSMNLVLDCPNENSHREQGFMWGYYDKNELLNVINIRIGTPEEYDQIHFNRNLKCTGIFPFSTKEAITLNEFINLNWMSLEIIKKQLKTILTFS